MRELSNKCVLAGLWLTAMPAVVMAAEPEHGGGDPVQVDLWQAGFTIAVFVLLVIILKTFAFKPILGALQKREDFIRESLEKAKADREQAEVRLKEYTERIEAARTEARDIVEEGRRDAEVVKQKIAEEAQAQATASIERGKREIAIATDSAIKDLYALGARIATDAASQIIRKELNPEDHERLVSESIEQLEKLN